MGYAGTGKPFWEQVEKTSTCWLWLGAINDAGYGIAYRAATQTVEGAHRFAYADLVGPIPAGRHLDHLCKVRHCVNPRHLEPVSCRENNLRSESPAALNAIKTHCIHGHEFTPENTYTPPKSPTRRNCKACQRDRDRSRREKATA